MVDYLERTLRQARGKNALKDAMKQGQGLMPDKDDVDGERRRLMHKRSIECDGYLRSDGLWEVEARLVCATISAANFDPATPLTTSACASWWMIP